MAAHPGYAATNLWRSGPLQGRRRPELLGGLVAAPFAQSGERGAEPSLYAATAPAARGGELYGPDRLFGFHGHPTRVAVFRPGRDKEAARRLWAASEQLTGVRYDALASG